MSVRIRPVVLLAVLAAAVTLAPIAGEERLWPLDKLTALPPEGAAVEAMLRAGEWEAAARGARKLWNQEINHRQPSRARIAAVMVLRALAQAGIGDSAAAACRWQGAQFLDGRLGHVDLSPYGLAGGRLLREPYVEAAAGSGDADVQPPKVTKMAAIGLPTEMMFVGGRGSIRVAGIVDERGSLRQPTIAEVVANAVPKPRQIELAGSLLERPGKRNLPMLLAISVLDSVCDCRFSPATASGKAVAYRSEFSIPYGGPLRLGLEVLGPGPINRPLPPSHGRGAAAANHIPD